MEVRGELPRVLLLAPGVEDGYACCRTISNHGVVDMFAQIVELQLSLAEPLDQFLRRGGHPVADVTHVNPLLLAEHIVEEELLLDLRPLQKGVVHALWASQRPAVPAFALAVVLRIVGTGGIYDSSRQGTDESAALPVRTREVVSGHAP